MEFTTGKLFRHLRKLIPGIPENVIEFNLHLTMDALPQLTITFLNTELNDVPITKTFNIMGVTDETV